MTLYICHLSLHLFIDRNEQLWRLDKRTLVCSLFVNCGRTLIDRWPGSMVIAGRAWQLHKPLAATLHFPVPSLTLPYALPAVGPTQGHFPCHCGLMGWCGNCWLKTMVNCHCNALAVFFIDFSYRSQGILGGSTQEFCFIMSHAVQSFQSPSASAFASRSPSRSPSPPMHVPCLSPFKYAYWCDIIDVFLHAAWCCRTELECQNTHGYWGCLDGMSFFFHACETGWIYKSTLAAQMSQYSWINGWFVASVELPAVLFASSCSQLLGRLFRCTCWRISWCTDVLFVASFRLDGENDRPCVEVCSPYDYVVMEAKFWCFTITDLDLDSWFTHDSDWEKDTDAFVVIMIVLSKKTPSLTLRVVLAATQTGTGCGRWTLASQDWQIHKSHDQIRQALLDCCVKG